MPRQLDQKAVSKVAKEIRLRRYLTVTVTDEELVREILSSYKEHTRRPPRQPPNMDKADRQYRERRRNHE